MRIVDLPWYDLPELTGATDAWWAGIAGHLRELGVERVPERLARDVPHQRNWEDADLLLSQACGYDVLYDSAHLLQPVATPCYTAGGCHGPRYRSAVVVHEASGRASVADLRGARCAVNEATSHSGTNALRPLVAPLSRSGAFFASVTATGSNRDSLAMVRERQADVACVDVVVLDLVRAVRPRDLEGLRTIATTELAVAPPYVTSRRTDPDTVRRLALALQRAADDPALRACREALLLAGFQFLPEGAYAELRGFELPALEHGYRELPAPRASPLHVARPEDGRRAAGARGPC